MSKTFSNLPDMGGTDLVGIGTIVLNFIIFKPGIFFHNNLHYLVGKTFVRSKGGIIFHHLYLCIFIYMHQASWLGKNINRTCIRNMININRMFDMLSFCLHE